MSTTKGKFIRLAGEWLVSVAKEPKANDLVLVVKADKSTTEVIITGVDCRWEGRYACKFTTRRTVAANDANIVRPADYLRNSPRWGAQIVRNDRRDRTEERLNVGL